MASSHDLQPAVTLTAAQRKRTGALWAFTLPLMPFGIAYMAWLAWTDGLTSTVKVHFITMPIWVFLAIALLAPFAVYSEVRHAWFRGVRASYVVFSQEQGGTLIRGNTFLEKSDTLLVPPKDSVTIAAKGAGTKGYGAVKISSLIITCSQGEQTYSLGIAAKAIDVTPLVRQLMRQGCNVTVDPSLPRPWESEPALLYAQ